MVFWGLVCTSVGFLLPAYLAFRKRRRLDAIASTALATTSVLFHTTFHPTIKVIDMTIAHSAGAYSMVRAIKSKDIWGMIATPICAFIFYGVSKGRDGPSARYGHMGMHMTAIAYWIAHLSGSPPFP
jgi:hypothetical protein